MIVFTLIVARLSTLISLLLSLITRRSSLVTHHSSLVCEERVQCMLPRTWACRSPCSTDAVTCPHCRARRACRSPRSTRGSRAARATWTPPMHGHERDVRIAHCARVGSRDRIRRSSLASFAGD